MPKHHYCYPRISRPSYGPVVVNIQRYIFLKIFFSMGVESFVSISGHNLALISQSQNEIHKSLCSLYHTFSKQNSLDFNSETGILTPLLINSTFCILILTIHDYFLVMKHRTTSGPKSPTTDFFSKPN